VPRRARPRGQLELYRQLPPGHERERQHATAVTAVSFPAEIAITACYANCDCSATAPILNVNDFTCFLNKFAAGDSYANCDNSTAAPILNVNDFTCFLNRFAAGCS